MTDHSLKDHPLYGFVDCPPVAGIVRTPEFEVVETFASNPYWEERYDALFAPDIHVQYPYAPPGMWQYFNPFEFGAHRYWLRNVIKNWKLTRPVTIIPTTEAGLFWVVRVVQADVVFGKRPGVFEAEILSVVTVKNGKITSLREFEDPLAYYKAMGDVLPTFFYVQDLIESPQTYRMAPGAVSKFSPEQNIARAVAILENPITGSDGDPEPMYSHDIVQACPFTAYDHYRINRGVHFDQGIEWMYRIAKVWNTTDKCEVHRTVDPRVYVVASYGYGELAWGFRPGHYIQREFMIFFADEIGKIQHFRVYFNSLMKFTSTNVRLQTLPYFNF